MRGTPFSAQSSLCPRLPCAAGCPHSTGCPVLPHTLAPALNQASAVSSLCRRLTKTSGSQPPAPSLPPEQPDCPLEQLYHCANPFRIFSTYPCSLPSSHQVCDRKRHFHIYWPNISNSLPQGSNCLCWLLSSPRNRGIHYNV